MWPIQLSLEPTHNSLGFISQLPSFFNNLVLDIEFSHFILRQSIVSLLVIQAPPLDLNLQNHFVKLPLEWPYNLWRLTSLCQIKSHNLHNIWSIINNVIIYSSLVSVCINYYIITITIQDQKILIILAA